MKLSANLEIVYLVTKRNEITLLTGLDQEDAFAVNQIKNIPGDEILDFCEFGPGKLLILSKDGYLSYYETIGEPNQMITVKKLYFNEGEQPRSIVACHVNNKICVASLKPNDNLTLSAKKSTAFNKPPKTPSDNREMNFNKNGAMIITQYSCLSMHVLEFDFKDLYFCMKFEKPFRIPMGLNEGSFDIDMNLSNQSLCRQGDKIDNGNPLILFMVLKKLKSDCFSFVLKDNELRSFCNLKLGGKVAHHQFQIDADNKGQMWVLGHGGNVRVFE